MGRWLIILICLILCGCAGTFDLMPTGHRLLYKSRNGQFSCYTNNCCFPYKEKIMFCSEAGMNNVMIQIKVVPEK